MLKPSELYVWGLMCNPLSNDPSVYLRYSQKPNYVFVIVGQTVEINWHADSRSLMRREFLLLGATKTSLCWTSIDRHNLGSKCWLCCNKLFWTWGKINVATWMPISFRFATAAFVVASSFVIRSIAAPIRLLRRPVPVIIRSALTEISTPAMCNFFCVLGAKIMSVKKPYFSQISRVYHT